MGVLLDFLTGDGAKKASDPRGAVAGSSRRVTAAVALPRVPTFSLTRPAASPNLSVVDSWPALSSSRQAALSVPTVKTCRDLIIGAAVQMGVHKYRGTERIDPGALLRQPDPDTVWSATLAGTLEDLIYEGRAYWIVLATDGVATEAKPDGYPVRARWIPVGDVELELERDAGSYSRLKGYRIAGVNGLVPAENVIRFDSPLGGLLFAGADAINKAIALEDAAGRMADVELPAGTLTNTGAELGPDEADELVTRFETARRDRTVAFLQGVEYKREQLSAEDLELVAARANSATELARLHNMPVAMVSASPSGGASAMLYANLGSTLSLMVSNAVAPYLAAIEQTLSSNAVTARGQRVAFDTAAFLRSDPAERAKYVLDLLGAEVIDVAEARGMLGLDVATAAPQPATVGA